MTICESFAIIAFIVVCGCAWFWTVLRAAAWADDQAERMRREREGR